MRQQILLLLDVGSAVILELQYNIISADNENNIIYTDKFARKILYNIVIEGCYISDQ